MLKTKLSIIATAVLLSLGLSACGGSSNSSTPAPTPTPTNSAPTAIALSATEVAENAVAATVGTLSTTDADSGDTFTYTIDDERFEVSGSELKLKADTSFNYEMVRNVPVKVTVKDSANAEFTQDFTVTVTDSMGVQAVIDDLGDLPKNYAFTSKFDAAKSSVSHSGQAARHVLISQLNSYIGNDTDKAGLAKDIKDGVITSGAEAKAKLMRMYASTEAQWDEDADDVLTFTTTPTAKQTTLREISSSHKNLQGKIAGQDGADSTQYKDWTKELVGWNEKGSTTPDGVVIALIDQLAANVQTQIDGTARKDIIDAPITKLYIQEDGTDIKQLLQKFILGAVAYSQGTDDYLDHATDGKGLKSNNLEQYKGTKAYTSMEHQFDEGFGYFGAAHNYTTYTDLEIRAKSGRDEFKNGYNDIDADGKIDLTGEINFGNSTNAAKRDLGTLGNAKPTDYTKQAFEAFVTGRAIISNAVTRDLTADELTTLLEQRDIAVLTWEKAIAATVVHYINDTNADLDKLGATDYSSADFANLAKHWSELKGFALNLQFNPHSPMTAEKFASLQGFIGMKPVLTKEEVAAYKAKLASARTLLREVYNFDADNVENW
ncbi:DUF4856 domain-containing protein [Psychrobium sp. nBUS_13]|uniref:DUF4856 domain-containing protein n=1 Tax=Psychrobium sp. nBUS_13 TaxID=3395319 RepID=UPI003EBFE8D0